MRDAFERILTEYPAARTDAFKDHEVARFIRALPEQLSASLKLDTTRYKISSSPGQGQWADIPWINVMDTRVTTRPTAGAYVVYLFRGDGQGVYLSLNQGWTYYKETFKPVSAARENAKTASDWWRSLLNDSAQDLPADEIDLASTQDNALGYEAGHILGKYYPVSALPSDEELQQDLRKALDAYQKLYGAYSVSSPTFEDFNQSIYVNTQIGGGDSDQDSPDNDDNHLEKIIAKNSKVSLTLTGQPESFRDVKPSGEFKTRKTDHAKRQKTNDRVGRIGEDAVVAFEKDSLVAAGRPDLAEKVYHVSAIDGDGAGYDILSYDENGNKKFIEVKTTRKGGDEPFLVSANEVLFSQMYKENFVLYRVYDFSPQTLAAKFYALPGSLQETARLDATQFAGTPNPRAEEQ